jgi:cytoskeleton protein RodZ
MTPIGETLRRERQRRNLGLDQVSQQLKISTRFLEAIEREQFERLPGGVFAKSFVRQYARLLDLDEDEAVAEVQRTMAPSAEGQGQETTGPPKTIPVANFSPRVSSIESRRFFSGSWLPALGLVVAVMLGCSLVYGWWQRERRTAAASPRAATSAPAQAKAAPVPASAASQPAPAQASEPVSASAAPAGGSAAEPKVEQAAAVSAASRATDQQDAHEEPTQSPLQPSGPVKVVLTTADEPVWVSARTDGKYAFSVTLEPNQTRTVDADGIVWLRLGNAGGVTITVNGKQIPNLGPKGQVRTVQLTSGGFQIVAPKPSALDDDPL